MTLRKGKLWKPCKKCGEMYPATTKFKGLCDKCNPKSNSFLNLSIKKTKNKTK